MNLDFNTGVHGINGHTYGIVMKEMATRAMFIIRSQMSSFKAEIKDNEHKLFDLVTTADKAAQEMIVKMIKENFPFAGIIAEEEGADITPSTAPHIYFTIDPLDGTKAFVRKQSDGIGCLIGMIAEDKIVGALIADIMTGEIYYFRPGSQKVHRVSEHRRDILEYKQQEKLRVLLLDDPRIYSSTVQQLTQPHDGFFESVAVSNGSVGTNIAKLYKGEVQAFITKPVYSNPWDAIPCIGIAQQLGYVFFEIGNMSVFPSKYEEIVNRESQQMGEIICIHKEDLPRLQEYLSTK